MSEAFWQPFTPTGYREQQGYRTIVRGEGLYVEDSAGKRLLDGTAGLWCVAVGHGRKEIADAMAKQASQLAYYSSFEYRTEPALALADRIAGLAPGDLNHVFFTSGGSESVDTMMKIARAYQTRRGQGRRTKILARELAYHGVCYGGTSLSGLTPMRASFEPLLPQTGRIAHHHCRHCPFGLERETCGLRCAEDLAVRLAQEDPSTVCAVVVEPMIGAGGVIGAPDGYLKRLAEICREHDILLVFDEVVTGFGRLGNAFAAERYGVTPDLITFAKGVTSAYAPLGGVIVSDRIHEAFVDAEAAPAPELPHGFTYSGHPVSCAAAMANLDIMEREGLWSHARELEPGFAAAMHELQGLSQVGEVRAVGLAAAVEYAPDLPVGFARAVSDACYERGLIVRPVRANTNVLSPPLTMQQEHAELLRDVMAEAIQAMAET